PNRLPKSWTCFTAKSTSAAAARSSAPRSGWQSAVSGAGNSFLTTGYISAHCCPRLKQHYQEPDHPNQPHDCQDGAEGDPHPQCAAYIGLRRIRQPEANHAEDDGKKESKQEEHQVVNGQVEQVLCQRAVSQSQCQGA